MKKSARKRTQKAKSENKRWINDVRNKCEYNQIEVIDDN